MTSDIERIEEQQRRLRLSVFDEDTAWSLGSDLRRRATELGVAGTIEVRLAGETVFSCAMRGTAPNNADWARRKRNVVEMLHRPSYAVGLAAERDGRSELALMGLHERDVVDHGGSFPIVADGVGCVGAVTVSGLPQRDDHNLVVEALADLCSVDHDEIRLPAPPRYGVPWLRWPP